MPPGKAGTGGIGAELAPARKPHGDDAGQDAQHQLGHDAAQDVAHADALLLTEHHAVDEDADDAGKEDDEGVQHPLQQGHGHHVAVGDVADLVAQHRLDLVGVHVLQQPGTHRHQCIVAVHAGGEGIGMRVPEDAHLGHADARLAGQPRHRLQQPLLGGIGGLLDDLHAHAVLGHGLGQGQRDERTAEADEQRHDENAVDLPGQALLCQPVVDAQHAHGHAEHDQDAEVGGEKEDDAHEHGVNNPLFF